MISSDSAQRAISPPYQGMCVPSGGKLTTLTTGYTDPRKCSAVFSKSFLPNIGLYVLKAYLQTLTYSSKSFHVCQIVSSVSRLSRLRGLVSCLLPNQTWTCPAHSSAEIPLECLAPSRTLQSPTTFIYNLVPNFNYKDPLDIFSLPHPLPSLSLSLSHLIP